MRWVAGPALRDDGSLMAVTESGHLASREIDDLYRAHVAEVYRYAYAVLGNHADAEDVTQTTFLNAYRALEQGVRPRKPTNWLLTIASNAIKQRFRQEQSRPRQVELDERIVQAGTDDEDDEGPSVGELLTALSKIPPQQRQAIVLREFEGRSYNEIAEILGISTSALETLLFRARRSLAEELQHQLTCTEAQLAVSQSVDGRLGRKERRRLRDHLGECPDCARFARLQQRHRSALRGLALVPIPLSLTLFKGLEGSAAAAIVPMSAGAGAVAVGAGVGTGATASGAGGVLAGGLGLKVAAVVAAAGVAGGVGVAGSSEVDNEAGEANASGRRTARVATRTDGTARSDRARQRRRSRKGLGSRADEDRRHQAQRKRARGEGQVEGARPGSERSEAQSRRATESGRTTEGVRRAESGRTATSRSQRRAAAAQRKAAAAARSSAQNSPSPPETKAQGSPPKKAAAASTVEPESAPTAGETAAKGSGKASGNASSNAGGPKER